ncbi:hypothetical protein Tco_0982482, partial [Tanacetum coccineum]
AGQPAAESLGGGTGVQVGRGGRGRRPREGNDERVDDLNGQGNNQGLGANGDVKGVNGNVKGVNGGVGNQGNIGNQNGNVVNENVQENVGNVLVNGNRAGCSYKELLGCNPKEYDCKGGVVVLTRWIEKMENVRDMSGCSVDQKVKYIAGSFVVFYHLACTAFLSSDFLLLCLLSIELIFVSTKPVPVSQAENPISLDNCMTRSSTKELLSPFENPEQNFRSRRRLFDTPSLVESNSPEFDHNFDIEEQLEEGGQFLKELHDDTFSGSEHKDANEHIEKVLEIVDLFHILKVTQDQIMLQAFLYPDMRAASFYG